MDKIFENETTNITSEVKEAFEAIASGKHDNFALFSCFLDGKPTSAIVSVVDDGMGGQYFSPLFVAVTDDIGPRLTDHDGIVPTKGAPSVEDWGAYLDRLLNS